MRDKTLSTAGTVRAPIRSEYGVVRGVWSKSAVSIVALYVIAGLFALSPLLWTSVPPLIDYPNHLARMAILAGVGDPAVASNYAPDWRLLPNLAMDLIVPPLARLIPLELAGRLFIAITLALLILGTALLRRILNGTAGFWALGSLLFIYNSVFWWGFLNYLFGLSAAILGFSLWIASKDWNPAVRLTIFTVVASVLFVLHLFALGVYGLLVISFEAGQFLSAPTISGFVRRFSYIGAQFVPAGMMWIPAMIHGGPTYLAYGGLSGRVFALVGPASFSNPPVWLDGGILIFVLAFLYIGFRSRALSLVPSMRLPIFAMLVGCVAMPEWIAGSWGASFRLPVALAFVLVASIRFEKLSRPAVKLVVGVATLLIVARVWTVSEIWHDLDRNVSEFRQALGTLPEGSRIFTVQSPMPLDAESLKDVPAALQKINVVAFSQWSALAVIDRGAFVPSLFTGWYPIEPSAKNEGMSRILGEFVRPEELARLASIKAGDAQKLPRDELGEPPCCLNWPSSYQFVIWIDFGRPPEQLPQHLHAWNSGSFFHIYRVGSANLPPQEEKN